MEIKLSAHIQKLRDSFFDFRERIQGYPKIHRLFERIHGYPLDIINPQTNNQRMVHKMITDRNPMIMITTDKVKVRDYIEEKLGSATAREILIPIYHISNTGKDIPNELWDFEFFLKANHSSGMNKIIPVGEDPKKVAELAQKWLNNSFG